MNRSKYPYHIGSTFDFGKYSGLNVSMVLSGTKYLPDFWVSSMISEFIDSCLGKDYINEDESENSVCNNFYLHSGGRQNQLSLQNGILRNGKVFNLGSKHIKNSSILDVVKEIFADNNNWSANKRLFLEVAEKYDCESGNSEYSLPSGNPSYLEWLITSTDAFFMAPEELKQLEQFPVCRWKKFALKESSYNAEILEVLPVIEQINFSFSKSIHDLNAAKYKVFEGRKWTHSFGSRINPYEGPDDIFKHYVF